jgi:hypothetical protein
MYLTKYSIMKTIMYLTKHHASKIPALDGCEWSASRPGHFTPGERAPGTYWIRDWVGTRSGQDAMAKRKFPALAGNQIPVVQPVA